jgi:hypothetical protein
MNKKLTILMPDEVKEQGVLTKKDLEQTIKALRHCDLDRIADKFEIQLKKFTKGATH